MTPCADTTAHSVTESASEPEGLQPGTVAVGRVGYDQVGYDREKIEETNSLTVLLVLGLASVIAVSVTKLLVTSGGSGGCGWLRRRGGRQQLQRSRWCLACHFVCCGWRSSVVVVEVVAIARGGVGQ